jgi:hypothetical protein
MKKSYQGELVSRTNVTVTIDDDSETYVGDKAYQAVSAKIDGNNEDYPCSYYEGTFTSTPPTVDEVSGEIELNTRRETDTVDQESISQLAAFVVKEVTRALSTIDRQPKVESISDPITKLIS